MARREITEEDHLEAIRRLLAEMAAGEQRSSCRRRWWTCTPRTTSSPARCYMRLAAEVLADTAAAGGRVEYEGLPERHLDGIEFRGKENR